MSEHLDGTYYALCIRGEDSAYFLSIPEGERLDSTLSLREEMAPEDRVDTIVFTDLAGLKTRLFIEQISSLQLSSPDQRTITKEISAELKARNIDL